MSTEHKLPAVKPYQLPADAPLEMWLYSAILEFERGCTDTISSGSPEDCPECSRAFVDAIKCKIGMLI
jgi:hypothetical protein